MNQERDHAIHLGLLIGGLLVGVGFFTMSLQIASVQARSLSSDIFQVAVSPSPATTPTTSQSPSQSPVVATSPVSSPTPQQVANSNTTNNTQTVFLRGDANQDGVVLQSDYVTINNWVTLGNGEIRCLDAADVNDDGYVNIGDVVFLQDFLFLGNVRQIPRPYPFRGVDTSADTLSCDSYIIRTDDSQETSGNEPTPDTTPVTTASPSPSPKTTSTPAPTPVRKPSPSPTIVRPTPTPTPVERPVTQSGVVHRGDGRYELALGDAVVATNGTKIVAEIAYNNYGAHGTDNFAFTESRFSIYSSTGSFISRTPWMRVAHPERVVRVSARQSVGIIYNEGDYIVRNGLNVRISTITVRSITNAVRFLRGDANQDAEVTQSDYVTINNWVTLGSGEIRCLDAADVNDDGYVNIGDVVFLQDFLFLGNVTRIPSPHPFRGYDMSNDSVSCESYDVRTVPTLPEPERRPEIILSPLDTRPVLPTPALTTDSTPATLVNVPITFLRGDANADGQIDLADMIVLANTHTTRTTLVCQDAADVNDDGMVDISDLIAFADWYGSSRYEIPLPGPYSRGVDRTPDGLTCAQYPR